MDYTTYVTRLQTMAVDSSTTFSTTMIPAAIDYAELRMYRDLDLLTTVTSDYSKTCTAGNRQIALPTNVFVTVQGANIITPVAAPTPGAGTRNPMRPVSRDFLEQAYPSSDGSAMPAYFAMLDAANIIVGPWPDAGYRVEFVGTYRPPSLSSTNTTTYLTLWFPDIFLAASMIFTAAYQKNFGAQADDPKMAMSWEQTYQQLLAGASIEEARRKFQASMWTALSPTPAATPTRG